MALFGGMPPLPGARPIIYRTLPKLEETFPAAGQDFAGTAPDLNALEEMLRNETGVHEDYASKTMQLHVPLAVALSDLFMQLGCHIVTARELIKLHETLGLDSNLINRQRRMERAIPEDPLGDTIERRDNRSFAANPRQTYRTLVGALAALRFGNGRTINLGEIREHRGNIHTVEVHPCGPGQAVGTVFLYCQMDYDLLRTKWAPLVTLVSKHQCHNLLQFAGTVSEQRQTSLQAPLASKDDELDMQVHQALTPPIQALHEDASQTWTADDILNHVDPQNDNLLRVLLEKTEDETREHINQRRTSRGQRPYTSLNFMQTRRARALHGLAIRFGIPTVLETKAGEKLKPMEVVFDDRRYTRGLVRESAFVWTNEVRCMLNVYERQFANAMLCIEMPLLLAYARAVPATAPQQSRERHSAPDTAFVPHPASQRNTFPAVGSNLSSGISICAGEDSHTSSSFDRSAKNPFGHMSRPPVINHFHNCSINVTLRVGDNWHGEIAKLGALRNAVIEDISMGEVVGE